MAENGFLRTEVWHALSVHFPIALLPVSTLTMLISFFIKAEKKRHWQNAACGLLFAGCLTAWISVYTGNLADSIVARKICDPTILKDHQVTAEIMTYIFSAATVFSALRFTNFLRSPLKRYSFYLSFILMVIGTGYLVYAGHIGASLVYEQGAGVQNHSVDCNELLE